MKQQQDRKTIIRTGEHKNLLMRKALDYDQRSSYKMKRPRVALLQKEEEVIRGTYKNP